MFDGDMRSTIDEMIEKEKTRPCHGHEPERCERFKLSADLRKTQTELTIAIEQANHYRTIVEEIARGQAKVMELTPLPPIHLDDETIAEIRKHDALDSKVLSAIVFTTLIGGVIMGMIIMGLIVEFGGILP